MWLPIIVWQLETVRRQQHPALESEGIHERPHGSQSSPTTRYDCPHAKKVLYINLIPLLINWDDHLRIVQRFG